MRILQLCYEYPPLGGGGARVVSGLSKELVRAGNKVDILTMGFSGLPKIEEGNGLRIYRVPSIRRKMFHCGVPEAIHYVARASLVARSLVRRNSYDINHAHFIFPDGLIAWMIKRTTGLPYIITAHGSDVPGYNPHRLQFAHKALSSVWTAVTRDAERIVCPSESLKSLVKERNVETDLSVIPNGIDTGKYNTDKPKKRRILIVTRMLERKGIQYFLKAVEGVPLDHEIHIVGDGPYLAVLRHIAQGIGNNIKFWGWLDDSSPEFKDLFETSSIFVFPSEAENFPIVLLEAMSAGMAIITTEGTGCAEVVGDAAMLVPPKDPHAIRRTLDRLVSSPQLCRDLGRMARKRLVENFGWPAIAHRYFTLYQTSLKHHAE